VTNKTLVLFTCNGMGDAPGELQLKLAGTFLSILRQDTAPGAIAFYGEGVRLACEGSPVLDCLGALAAKGVTLILCQTCLDYFGLRGDVRAGVIGSMADIVTAMSQADKVISV
jgi:hypothetical protein